MLGTPGGLQASLQRQRDGVGRSEGLSCLLDLAGLTAVLLVWFRTSYSGRSKDVVGTTDW